MQLGGNMTHKHDSVLDMLIYSLTEKCHDMEKKGANFNDEPIELTIKVNNPNGDDFISTSTFSD